MRTIISCPVFMLPRTESQPTLATLVCCCASAFMQSTKSVVHRAKLRRFRLFIFFALTFTLLPHACASFLCLNLGRTYTFHCRRKSKRPSKMVGFSCQCSVLVGADLTLNQRVRSWDLRLATTLRRPRR